MLCSLFILICIILVCIYIYIVIHDDICISIISKNGLMIPICVQTFRWPTTHPGHSEAGGLKLKHTICGDEIVMCDDMTRNRLLIFCVLHKLIGG